MMATGFFEMLIMSSWFMLPLGVPPGPEDPMLAKIAPEKCLYYVSSAGTAAPEAASGNQTEKLLLDPEIKEFTEQLFPRIKKSINKLIAEQGAPADQAAVVKAMPTFIETLLTEPSAVFLSDLQLADDGGPPRIRGALVVNVARKKKAVQDAFGEIQPLLQQVAQNVEVGGQNLSRIDMGQMERGFPLITYGFADDYFILGVGKDSVADLLKRQQTPAPDWLTDAQNLLKVPRRSTFAYADLKSTLLIVQKAMGDESVNQMLVKTGLSKADSYINVTGLDKQGWIGRTLLRIEGGEPKGWMTLLAEAPLEPNDLANVPNDAILAFAGRTDPNKLLDVFRSVFTLRGGNAAEEWNAMVMQVKQFTSVDINDDLLPQLGDVWQVHTTPREGDLITGWTGSLTIKDRDKVSDINKKITQAMTDAFAGQFRAPRIKMTKFADHELYSFVVPDDDFLVEPTWCITKDRIVVAAYPQPIKTYLRGNPGGKSLTDVPEVARQFESKQAPTFLGYQDTATVVQRLYPFAQIGLKAFLTEMQEEGFDIDLGMLPSCDAITRHLRPGVQSTRWTKFGLYTETRQTFPSGNIGAVMPLAMVGVAPATFQARAAAQRAQGMNNMRQIALAMLNYESATQAFPARYSTDADGKPLLSWRVHILPYMEENQLYEQFKLDEPWNSPHNRKLIARMPNIYRAPNSRTDPGKTTYLAIESEKAVIVPPKKDGETRLPKGRRIREIADGTSKTVLVVGAADESAMIWTKPGDFEPDQNDPFKGLVDDRQGGFFHAVFCDGHASMLSRAMGKETIQLLIDVSDGRPVRNF